MVTRGKLKFWSHVANIMGENVARSRRRVRSDDIHLRPLIDVAALVGLDLVTERG